MASGRTSTSTTSCWQRRPARPTMCRHFCRCDQNAHDRMMAEVRPQAEAIFHRLAAVLFAMVGWHSSIGRIGPIAFRDKAMSKTKARYDAVILGAGHNGPSPPRISTGPASVLEKNTTSGATTSQKVFPDYEAYLSCYSYLVSLFPEKTSRSGIESGTASARNGIVHAVYPRWPARRAVVEQRIG